MIDVDEFFKKELKDGAKDPYRLGCIFVYNYSLGDWTAFTRWVWHFKASNLIYFNKDVKLELVEK